MALPTNSYTQYDAVGNREDLSNVIHNISPTDTPFMTLAGSTKVTSVKHEWQTDSLAAASSSNAVLEGDDATVDASTATVRLSNYTQISDKVASVTGTQRAVDSAGRKDEMDYQLMKRGKELKRDMESSLTANNATVVGNNSTARELGGYEAWVTSNVSRGASGSNGGLGTTAATDGTARAFTESLLKDVIQSAWTNGGTPSVLMVGGYNKQVVSTFTGGGNRFDRAEDSTVFASVDIYVSDFGKIKVIPNRFSRARSALLLDKEYWKVGYLRNMQSVPLAKTGDTDQKQLICEYTLESCNEAASGIIADLTTS